jgi:hypothetical protein
MDRLRCGGVSARTVLVFWISFLSLIFGNHVLPFLPAIWATRILPLASLFATTYLPSLQYANIGSESVTRRRKPREELGMSEFGEIKGAKDKRVQDAKGRQGLLKADLDVDSSQAFINKLKT